MHVNRAFRMHALIALTGVVVSLGSVTADVFGTAPSPNEGVDGVFEGAGEGSFAAFPRPLPPPPPGLPGMCGDLGEDCCEGLECSAAGTACAAYDVYAGSEDYYADAFTCQECGGIKSVEDYVSIVGSVLQNRVGQIACDDGAPCEAGLVFDMCGRPFSASSEGTGQCTPCGKKGEKCCASEACEGDMQCMDYDTCGNCGALREKPCPATSGVPMCNDGLVARLAPPADEFSSDRKACLPPLECGTDPGAECCTDGGPACFGTDGFGTPLACIDGTCKRCGLRGTPPCTDGCVEGLVETRGLCRGPDEVACGLSGESCCGNTGDVYDYGPECEDGLSCDYSSSESSSPEAAPSPASPRSFRFRGGSSQCVPCGGNGESICRKGFKSECDDGLEPDFFDYGPGPTLCKPVPNCGTEGAAPCTDGGRRTFLGGSCPCKPGLILTDGVCVVSVTRSSAPAVAPADAK